MKSVIRCIRLPYALGTKNAGMHQVVGLSTEVMRGLSINSCTIFTDSGSKCLGTSLAVVMQTGMASSCNFDAMYVCIEVALCGDAHGIGRSNWAWGRDLLVLWVQMSQPLGTIDTASRTLVHTCAPSVLSVTNFTLGS